MVKYYLVYRVFPRRVYALKYDGFYHQDGWARGNLIMSISMGRKMYHRMGEIKHIKVVKDE